MNISFKKILAAFGIIFLMSRSRNIINWFDNFSGGDILTLEPLRRCSEDMRYVVTMAFLFMIFVIFWQLFLRNR
jgi:hypothetical protein